MHAILFQQRAPVTSFRAGAEVSRSFFRAPPMSTNKLLPALRATSLACPCLCLTFSVQRTKTKKSSSCSRSQQQQMRQQLERACRHESGKYQTLVCTGYFWIGQWQISASRCGRAAGASVRSQVLKAHRWRGPRISFALRQACQRSLSSGSAQMFGIICARLAGAALPTIKTKHQLTQCQAAAQL